ncbi:MAG: hypothetical protein QF752_02410 [Planctomycetota bacterium]|nr:hypothetical protein [Planctomycetota bacterium]
MRAFTKEKKNLYLRKFNIVKWSSPLAEKYDLDSIPSLWLFGPDGQLIVKGYSEVLDRLKTLD